MDDPTQIQRYYKLREKITELAQAMGLDMDHCSILLEESDPKLALVFTVKPEAFVTASEDEQAAFDDEFTSIIGELKNPNKDDGVIPEHIRRQAQEFLEGNDGRD